MRGLVRKKDKKVWGEVEREVRGERGGRRGARGRRQKGKRKEIFLPHVDGCVVQKFRRIKLVV